MFLLFIRVEQISIDDVSTKAKLGGNFLADGYLIASNHFDIDPHLLRCFDSAFGIFLWRIKQREHAQELPFSLSICARHAQRPESASGKLIDGFYNLSFYRFRVFHQVQDDLWCALGHFECFARPRDTCFGALMDRIEWYEMNN